MLQELQNNIYLFAIIALHKKDEKWMECYFDLNFLKLYLLMPYIMVWFILVSGNIMKCV